MSPGFDHVALACRDPEALRVWYEEVLGFRTLALKSPSRPGVLGATFLVGPEGSATALELTPDDGLEPRGREPFTRGISHIALRVGDYAAWEARLTEKGVRWLGDPVEALGGGRLRSFLDPEGNMLQIVQRP
ncbi:MAG: VOC family protein [Planctomycetes bacterium]|nr:VOC family protein [Planctomycetota bacterium]